MSSDDLFSDSQSSPATPLPDPPSADEIPPVVIGIVNDSVEVEFVEPPKKKKKIETDASLEALQKFSVEMINVERERTEILKQNDEKRLQLLAEKNQIAKAKQEILEEKNAIAKERNELLKALLEK